MPRGPAPERQTALPSNQCVLELCQTSAESAGDSTVATHVRKGTDASEEELAPTVLNMWNLLSLLSLLHIALRC